MKDTNSQLTFFDYSRRMEKVEEYDRLPALKGLVPWEQFRGLLEKATRKLREESVGGRPAFDAVKMFRILVLQRLYNLSDDALEFRLNDSLSFQRFVGIGSSETVPDAKTIWHFREQLTQSGAVKKLFARFEEHLALQGYQATSGTIMDATVVEVPRKGFTSSEDYKQVKSGELPKKWTGNVNRMRQLDRDARFTVKGGKFLYGYKNHINVDVKYKLIRECEVTAASVNESLVAAKLLNQKNRSASVYGDSAYDTKRVSTTIKKLNLRSEIQRQRRHPSIPEDKFKKYNAKRSIVRRRVEHIFGHQVVSMKAKVLRYVGKLRVEAATVLNNLVYNMSRYRYLEQLPA